MSKIIILSRVSTEHQALESQTLELRNYAVSQGYSEEDIIVIENKESAIKLSEEERDGLNRMKDYIENEDISEVVCYEVSRLSRKQNILFNIKEYLQKKKVQLIILKPTFIRLFDSQWNTTPDGSLIFTLFSYFSEQEMSTKKVRMKRGKDYKKNCGKWIGGNILFGYKVRKEDDSIVVDEEKAELVRQIFDMYAHQDFSIDGIVRELTLRGDMTFDNFEVGHAKINNMLRNKGYIGEGKTYPYSAIISKELFEECEIKRKKNNRMPHKTTMVYYGQKLLFYKGLERMLTPSKANCVYQLVKKDGVTDMIFSFTTNVNFIDSVIWHIVKQKMLISPIQPDNSMINKMKLELSILKRKRIQCLLVEKKLKKTIEKTNERIVEGKIKENVGDKLLDKYESQLEENLQNLKTFNVQYKMKQNQIKSYDEQNNDLDINMLDDTERYNLIKKYINKIYIEKGEKNGSGKLFFHFNDGTVENYSYFCNGGKRELVKDNNKIEFEFIKRIVKRKLNIVKT